jgi:predicted RNA binding protein YcfA (HicA-like mRNA interferase family)
VARLANISGKEAVKALQKAGWETAGQVESHLVMTKPGLRVNLSVP